MNPYFIVCTSRTGSTYLCHLLESTGVMGKPREYINRKDEFLADWNCTDADYLDEVARRTATPNGVFGVKGNLDAAVTCLEHYGRDTQVIWLYRDDTIMQAISIVKAQQTGRWHSFKPETDVQPEYDRIAIQKQIDIISNAEWDIDEWLPAESLLVVYENLCLDARREVSRICEFLGVEFTGTLPETRLDIMRDDTSNEWAKRYKEGK